MSPYELSKERMFNLGLIHIRNWCRLNGCEPPDFRQYWSGTPDFGVCAYYRDGVVHIWPKHCAGLGTAGRSWSWPGYVVDRTPYGVVAHELAHHLDGAAGPAGGTLSHEWRQRTGAAAITGYCPNDNEWMAEHFRLYVTNPNLHAMIAPSVHACFREKWPESAETRDWRQVLAGADRQLRAAENKIKAAQPRGLIQGGLT